jgi:hypothetical protein
MYESTRDICHERIERYVANCMTAIAFDGKRANDEETNQNHNGGRGARTRREYNSIDVHVSTN